MPPFDCKDENSFGFSLFVDLRFKLCSVVLIWIKHALLFRNTIEPPLTTTSTQWPFFFLADSPYIHSCFNLSTTATSLQWPLKTVLRNNSLLLESNARPRCFVFFFFTTRNCRTSAKEKEKKKRESRTRHRSGWAYCDTTFHLSPYIITECEFLCSVKIAECQWRSYRTFLSTSEWVKTCVLIL